MIHQIVVIVVFCTYMARSAPVLPSQDKDRRIVLAPRPNAIDVVEQLVTLPPKPYQFGYELEDGYGMSQFRSEASDGFITKGSYGYMDPAGVYRKVEYTADRNGYRAIVRSNEPGTANQNVADALFIVEPPPAGVIAQGLAASEFSPRDIKS